MVGSYSVKKFFTQAPEKIASGIIVIINALVASGIIDWDVEFVGAINIVVMTVLTLCYVSPNVSSNRKLRELSEDK